MATEDTSSGSSAQTGARADLAELRRAEVLVHTRYPEPSRWYPAWLGALVGIWIASFAAPGRVGLPIRLAVFVVFLVGVLRYNRRRGTQPILKRAPRQIRNALLVYVGCVAAMVATLGLLWSVAPWWLVAVIGVVGTVLGTRWYLRYFAAAARRAELDNGLGGPVPTT